jgi:hypothetical protein
MQELLDQLSETITAHYPDADARPLFLSTFGQKHPELLKALKDEFGSLKQAIKAAGEERLRLVGDTPGSEVVAPANVATQVGQRLEQSTAAHKTGATSFDCLPGSVRLAFVTKTEAGENVAIETTRPFRFSKVTDPALIAPSQRIIAEQYRRPGMVPRNATIQDRAALWGLFLAWAEAAGVDPKTFQMTDTTALARLIAAQPRDIISRIVIPADIAQLLMKHN